MVKSSIGLGQKAKSILLGIFLLVIILPDANAREGRKLFSIGDNPLWNSKRAWSLSIDGKASGLVPQGNDTLVIDRTISQNVNFILSGQGLIIVTATGVLHGDNEIIGFWGNSALVCYGEIKSDILLFNENAGFMIEDKGIVSVNQILETTSSFNHYIYGKLSVSGKLTVNQPSKINGNGIIESAHYEGNGSVFSISNLSLIPDGSVVTEANWIGIHSSDWNDPANWTGGILPVKASNISVLVSSNYPSVSGEQFCNNLFVNSSASLTLQSSTTFTVNGILAVIGLGKILIKDTVTEKASLIAKGPVSGNIQSERLLVASKKLFIASPTSNSFW